MDSGRDSFIILRYTYMMVLVYAFITGINTTACTDQTRLDNINHVISMCNSGTLINSRVVIDTWGTGGDSRYSCKCTVTLDTESVTSTLVVVQEYPTVEPLQNCGSILTITSTKSNIHTKTGCIPIPSTLTTDFGTSDKLTLTLSRADVSTPWISGHCILISQNPNNLNLTVTCTDAQGGIDQSPTTTTTTTTTTTEYVPTTTTTTTQSIETTTSLRETRTSTQSREVTTYNNTSTGQTTSGQEKCNKDCLPQQGYPLSAVVAPLVVTMLIIAVSAAANVILYRRLALVKQPKNIETAITSPNLAHYDSLDLSRVEPPNLYADTSTGQTYVNTAS